MVTQICSQEIKTKLFEETLASQTGPCVSLISSIMVHAQIQNDLRKCLKAWFAQQEYFGRIRQREGKESVQKNCSNIAISWFESQHKGLHLERRIFAALNQRADINSPSLREQKNSEFKLQLAKLVVLTFQPHDRTKKVLYLQETWQTNMCVQLIGEKAIKR